MESNYSEKVAVLLTGMESKKTWYITTE
jgi:hypothetical protein